MLQSAENRTIRNLAGLALRFIAGYVKYFFLTGSVAAAVFVMLFVILNVDPDFSFGFMRHFSFLDAAYGTGSFSLGMKEVMRIFSVVSLALMAVASLAKLVLRKALHVDASFSRKSRMILFFAVISLFYAAALVIVAAKDDLDKGFYPALAIFYAINAACMAVYFAIDLFSTKISEIFEKSKS